MRQFAALYDRLIAKRQHEEQCFGTLASVTANFSMGKDPKSPPLTPRDFFPGLPEPEPEEMSSDEIFAVLQKFANGRTN